MMAQWRPIVAGIADCRTSTDTGCSLVTYSLGSCVAVAAYDPVARAGGILHCLLPESRLDPERARRNPATFVDTGVRLLLDRLTEAGGDRKRLRIRLAGGAQMIETTDLLNIGRRNLLAARKVLWQLGLLVEMEAVGGTVSRDLGLDLATGEFWVRTHEKQKREERECPCAF
ncbi:MAG: chemotaxis protein CheD [Bryobacterales bacterium]|nr:chemotaxis protein CheD [Bryobacterales bacterium]